MTQHEIPSEKIIHLSPSCPTMIRDNLLIDWREGGGGDQLFPGLGKQGDGHLLTGPLPPRQDSWYVHFQQDSKMFLVPPQQRLSPLHQGLNVTISSQLSHGTLNHGLKHLLWHEALTSRCLVFPLVRGRPHPLSTVSYPSSVEAVLTRSTAVPSVVGPRARNS